MAPDDVRGRGPQIGPQRLHPWPVWGRPGILPSASPQDLVPALACPCRELVRQPALADPGLATEQDQSTAPETRLVEVLQQFAKLALAPHERRTCVGWNHRSLSSLCHSVIRAASPTPIRTSCGPYIRSVVGGPVFGCSSINSHTREARSHACGVQPPTAAHLGSGRMGAKGAAEMDLVQHDNAKSLSPMGRHREDHGGRLAGHRRRSPLRVHHGVAACCECRRRNGGRRSATDPFIRPAAIGFRGAEHQVTGASAADPVTQPAAIEFRRNEHDGTGASAADPFTQPAAIEFRNGEHEASR